MQIIPLNKGSLSLPTTWEELTPAQADYAFGLLIQLIAGVITPQDYRLKLFVKVTNYKPSRWLRKKYQDARLINLATLASKLDFVFALTDNIIKPNLNFKRNPFSNLSPYAPDFTLDVTIETNLTAKQYSDGFDLILAYQKLEDAAQKEYCLYRLFSLLYMVEFEQAKKYPVTIVFGVYCWFLSVVDFFQNSYPYSILFMGDKKETEEQKVSFGFNGIIISLEKEGFQYAEEMNLLKFFDTQVIMLKDMISKAIASGAKPEDLARDLGLPLSIIDKLN